MTRLALSFAALAAVTAFVMARTATADTTPVAYVGCSVSEMSVLGYHAVGGARMWPSNGKYDSGLVSTWAHDVSRYWPAFDHMNALEPGAQEVWWELCVQTGTTTEQLDADAHTVLARLRQRMPDATVYVSALAPYPDHLCATTGTDGIDAGAAEAASLVSEGVAQAGPIMAPLDLKHVYVGSPCHPNVRGQVLEGNVLRGFFG